MQLKYQSNLFDYIYILKITSFGLMTNYGIYMSIISFLFASQASPALDALSEVCSGIFGVGAEFFFNPEELVILGESLRPAGSSGLDLASAEPDHKVGNEAVLGLAGPVGHHRAPALALRHVVSLDGLRHASNLVHLRKVPSLDSKVRFNRTLPSTGDHCKLSCL